MRRYDLRHLADNFEQRMNELCEDLPYGEVSIFLFAVRDFSNVQQAIDCILNRGYDLLTSLRFNEVEWSIVVKMNKQ